MSDANEMSEVERLGLETNESTCEDGCRIRVTVEACEGYSWITVQGAR